MYFPDKGEQYDKIEDDQHKRQFYLPAGGDNQLYLQDNIVINIFHVLYPKLNNPFILSGLYLSEKADWKLYLQDTHITPIFSDNGLDNLFDDPSISSLLLTSKFQVEVDFNIQIDVTSKIQMKIQEDVTSIEDSIILENLIKSKWSKENRNPLKIRKTSKFQVKMESMFNFLLEDRIF